MTISKVNFDKSEQIVEEVSTTIRRRRDKGRYEYLQNPPDFIFFKKLPWICIVTGYFILAVHSGST